MKTEEKIMLAGAGIAALVILGLLMNRGKPPAAGPTQPPSTPTPSNSVVAPPTSQPTTGQSCLW